MCGNGVVTVCTQFHQTLRSKMPITQLTVVGGKNLVGIDTDAKKLRLYSLIAPFHVYYQFSCDENSKLAVSPDGHYIAVSRNNQIILLDVYNELEAVFSYRGHTGPILDIIMSDTIIISTSEDKQMRVWDIKERTCVNIIKSVFVQHCLTWRRNNPNQFYAGSNDDGIRLWSVDGHICQHYPMHTNSVISHMIDHGNHMCFIDKKMVMAIYYESRSVFRFVTTTTHCELPVKSIQCYDENLISLREDNMYMMSITSVKPSCQLIVGSADSFVCYNDTIYYTQNNDINFIKVGDAPKVEPKDDKKEIEKKRFITDMPFDSIMWVPNITSLSTTLHSDGTTRVTIEMTFAKTEADGASTCYEELKKIVHGV